LVKVKFIFLSFTILILLGNTTIHYDNKVSRENIKEIKNNADNYDIYIVTGKLINKISNTSHYILSDGTAEMIIRIEDYMWQQIDSKFPQLNILLSILVIVNKDNNYEPELEAIRIRYSKNKNYNEESLNSK
jgi:galactitol-specific phosphotransferase system IIB component